MLRTMSDVTGSFEFFVPHRSNYRIGVELGSADWCHVWHADEAVANAGEDAALVWVGLRSITKIEIAIPADKCAYRIEGDVTGADAQPLGGILVQAIADDHDELTWITGYTAAAGTFALEVPDPGDYRVSVELNACRAVYQHGGVVLKEDRASLVSILDSNVSGLRIQLSEGICELQLSGVLFDAVSVPLDDVNVVPIAWIVAFADDAEAADYAGSDGRFRLRGPTDGILCGCRPTSRAATSIASP